MRFMMRVEVADRSGDYAVVWSHGELAGDHRVRVAPDSLGGRELFVARSQLEDVMSQDREPAPGRSRPAGLLPAYPGSVSTPTTAPSRTRSACSALPFIWTKAVIAVRRRSPGSTLGRPPRRLVRLHLDGSVDALPAPGAELELEGAASVSSAARHVTTSSGQ